MQIAVMPQWLCYDKSSVRLSVCDVGVTVTWSPLPSGKEDRSVPRDHAEIPGGIEVGITLFTCDKNKKRDKD